MGKSTWINGFANYLTYPTLHEAEINDPIYLIPTTFTMIDDNFQERVIKTGEDKNEINDAGQSATQHPKTYLFEYSGLTVRLIDTPGIGDTRGIGQDKENFKNIMKHIENLNSLHGICILLKPNSARHTVMFQYCVKELLANLHVDAIRSIVFCYTNCRSTFYQPGDTMPTIKRLLLENKVPIELDRDITYCIDNEAVRFLAALRGGIQFNDSQCQEFSKSWTRSVEEMERMMKRFASLEPHQVKNTCSINEARRIISVLIRPIVEISATIQENIGAIETAKANLQKMLLTGKKKFRTFSGEILSFETTEMKTVKLERPLKVCMSAKCVSQIRDGNVTKYLYTCQLKKKSVLKALAFCGKKSSDCKQCGCTLDAHKKIAYDVQKIHNAINATAEHVTSPKEAKQIVADFTRRVEERDQEMVAEQRQITLACVKFACFLKKYAITPFNDALDEYMAYIIRVEQNKQGGGDEKTLRGMENTREEYKNQCKLFDGESGNVEQLTADKILSTLAELYKMKHTGEMLHEAMQVAEYAEEDESKFKEIRVKTLRNKQAKQAKRNILQIVSAAMKKNK